MGNKPYSVDFTGDQEKGIQVELPGRFNGPE
jgi:hypothetical protein